MLATALLAVGALAVPHRRAQLDAQLAENTASGDEHHLWFYWVNPHPTGFGAPKDGPWCGEIDAARLVPDALFQKPLRLYHRFRRNWQKRFRGVPKINISADHRLPLCARPK